MDQRTTKQPAHWTAAQQLAPPERERRLVATGDLYGTGTVSSFDPAAMGCLLEIPQGGALPASLADAGHCYLLDGTSLR